MASATKRGPTPSASQLLALPDEVLKHVVDNNDCGQTLSFCRSSNAMRAWCRDNKVYGHKTEAQYDRDCDPVWLKKRGTEEARGKQGNKSQEMRELVEQGKKYRTTGHVRRQDLVRTPKGKLITRQEALQIHENTGHENWHPPFTHNKPPEQFGPHRGPDRKRTWQNWADARRKDKGLSSRRGREAWEAWRNNSHLKRALAMPRRHRYDFEK